MESFHWVEFSKLDCFSPSKMDTQHVLRKTDQSLAWLVSVSQFLVHCAFLWTADLKFKKNILFSSWGKWKGVLLFHSVRKDGTGCQKCLSLHLERNTLLLLSGNRDILFITLSLHRPSFKVMLFYLVLLICVLWSKPFLNRAQTIVFMMMYCCLSYLWPLKPR